MNERMKWRKKKERKEEWKTQPKGNERKKQPKEKENTIEKNYITRMKHRNKETIKPINKN